MQLTGKLSSKSWTLLKSTEKQKWCDAAGTAIFCPDVTTSDAPQVASGWASEAGTEPMPFTVGFGSLSYCRLSTSLSVASSLVGGVWFGGGGGAGDSLGDFGPVSVFSFMGVKTLFCECSASCPFWVFNSIKDWESMP